MTEIGSVPLEKVKEQPPRGPFEDEVGVDADEASPTDIQQGESVNRIELEREEKRVLDAVIGMVTGRSELVARAGDSTEERFPRFWRAPGETLTERLREIHRGDGPPDPCREASDHAEVAYRNELFDGRSEFRLEVGL